MPPEALPCTVHTLLRPLGRFPPGFEAKVKSDAKGLISPMNNERMPLSSLLGLRCCHNLSALLLMQYL
jgi:DNA polymerase alpha subunit A